MHSNTNNQQQQISLGEYFQGQRAAARQNDVSEATTETSLRTVQPVVANEEPTTPTLTANGTTFCIDYQLVVDDDYGNYDVVWSLASNSFFIGGGLCYVAGAIWDFNPPEESSFRYWPWLLYNIVWTLGPLVYLLNAIIDILWAWRVKLRDKQKRAKKEQRPAPEDPNNDTTLVKATTATPPTETKKKKKRPRPRKIWKRVRKHMGHRRELSAAVTFGLAAACALSAMVVTFWQGQSDHLEGAVLRLDFCSVHFYLLSAIFALCGRKMSGSNNDTSASGEGGGGSKRWSNFWHDAHMLEDLGDAFFGIGSVVDVVLCNFHFDDDVAFWPVFSAFLWFIDACFYLRSDYCVLYSKISYKKFDTADAGPLDHFLGYHQYGDDNDRCDEDSSYASSYSGCSGPSKSGFRATEIV